MVTRTTPLPLLTLLALLIPAGGVRAHNLVVNCLVLPGGKVQVTCLFSSPFGSSPAAGATVQVFRPNKQVLLQGQTDEKGEFVFSYDKVEPLRVAVSETDHEREVTIPERALKRALAPKKKATPGRPTGKNGEGSPGETNPTPEGGQGKPVLVSSADNPTREGVKDVVLGVGFVLALAAFVLSLRNARRLRDFKADLNHRDTETQRHREEKTKN